MERNGQCPSETDFNGSAGHAQNGRDAAGRFAAGNKAAKGNPFARRVARLRSVLLDAVSDEDLRQIAQGLVRRARNGDAAAAKVLLAYVLGKPAPVVDPDSLDQDEWRRLVEQPDIVEVAMAKTAKVEPAVAVEALELHRSVNPSASKLNTPAVLAAAGERLVMEQGIAVAFNKDGVQIWPPLAEAQRQ